MKKIFLLTFLVLTVFANAQYSPSLWTVLHPDSAFGKPLSIKSIVEDKSTDRLYILDTFAHDTMTLNTTLKTLANSDTLRAYFDSTRVLQIINDSIASLEAKLDTTTQGKLIEGGGININNDTISVDTIYTDATFQGYGTKLSPLGLYITPDITSFTNDVNSIEIGLSISSVNLNWTINKTITSQSLNEGIGALDPLLRTYEYTTPFTTNKTFTLTVSDGINPDNRNTSVYFRNKRYWGANVSTSLNDTEIKALNQELATSRQMTKTIDCSGGQYFYIVYPEDFGAATFKVGGLDFSAMTLLIRDFINASGHNESYRIYRSTTLQFGSALNIQVL